MINFNKVCFLSQRTRANAIIQNAHDDQKCTCGYTRPAQIMESLSFYAIDDSLDDSLLDLEQALIYIDPMVYYGA